MPGLRKKQVNFGGETVQATVMPFQASSENFNEYLVDDGTVIQIKLVVAEILRVDGAYDPQGNPLYLLNSTNVVSVSAPDELMKPKDDQ